MSRKCSAYASPAHSSLPSHSHSKFHLHLQLLQHLKGINCLKEFVHTVFYAWKNFPFIQSIIKDIKPYKPHLNTLPPCFRKINQVPVFYSPVALLIFSIGCMLFFASGVSLFLSPYSISLQLTHLHLFSSPFV